MYAMNRLLCAVALLVTSAIVADDRAETIETLLKELRELKQTQLKETRQANDEFRRARRLLTLKTRDTEEEAKQVNSLKQDVVGLQATLDAETAKAKELATQRDALESAIQTAAKRLLERSNGNDFLLSSASATRLKALLTPDTTLALPSRCAGLLSILLDSSTDMVRTRLVNHSITIDGKERHVESIHFGALFALWRTMDGSRCGYGMSDGTKTIFADLPPSDVKSIGRACRILRNEEPATVLQLPVPMPEAKQ